MYVHTTEVGHCTNVCTHIHMNAGIHALYVSLVCMYAWMYEYVHIFYTFCTLYTVYIILIIFT